MGLPRMCIHCPSAGHIAPSIRAANRRRSREVGLTTPQSLEFIDDRRHRAANRPKSSKRSPFQLSTDSSARAPFNGCKYGLLFSRDVAPPCHRDCLGVRALSSPCHSPPVHCSDPTVTVSTLARTVLSLTEMED